MTESPVSLWGRLYRVLLPLLPRDLRRSHGPEMARTFDRLVRDERPGVRRMRRALHGVGGLIAVAAMERWDARRYRAPDSTRTRTTDGRTTMDRWIKDLRYALRTLRRSPAFSAGAVLLMAVGIGAVTAVFTLVDHVLLRPLPYPEAERLVTLEDGSFPGPMVRRMDEVEAFEMWAAGWSTAATLTGEGDPVRVEQARVTVDFFRLFGGNAVQGRLLAPDDATTADAVVLSQDFWMRQWGGDPGVIGRTLTIDDAPVTVVGVLDRAFSPPSVLVSDDADLWRNVDWGDERNANHNYHVLEVVGRLRPGATAADARAGVDALVVSMGESAPGDYVAQDGTPWAVPVTALQDVTVRGVRTGLGLLLGAVGLLLAVACTNVAHLFLARGLGRGREMAVRRALGADTRSLTRQLTAEALVVGAAGGLLGTALALGGLAVFRSNAPAFLPPGTSVGIDLRILAFAAAVSVATALIFGLLPAVRSLRRDPAAGLRGAGRGSSAGRRLGVARSGMLVAEVALSMVLLAGSGLLMRSFLTVRSVDPGLDAPGLWTVPLTPTDIEGPQDYVRSMGEVTAAVAALPEVESAAFALALPFTRTGTSRCCWSRSGLTVSEYDGEDPRLMIHPVSRSYFATLGIELLEGTAWPEAESYAEPVPAVVTASTASALWGSPARAPGRTFADDDGVWLEVVGVVADHSHFGLDQEMGPSVFVPMEVLPFPISIAEVAFRVRGDAPADLGRRVREAVWGAAPALPVPTVRSMDEMISASTATRRFDGVAFTTFGVLALLLAAGGLYGTLLYTVGQRRREMGIRMALGADRRTVEGQVMSGGVVLAAAGVAVGLAGAWFSGRLLESRLWGIAPSDPVALAGAAALLLTVAALASWLPARRAARTDPVETLKAE